MMPLAIALLGVSTAWIIVGLVSVLRATRCVRVRERPSRAPRQPPVTVLKPLCGADAQLADNLITFFEQDYPSYELVFGVQDPQRPGACRSSGTSSAATRKCPARSWCTGAPAASIRRSTTCSACCLTPRAICWW